MVTMTFMRTAGVMTGIAAVVHLATYGPDWLGEPGGA